MLTMMTSSISISAQDGKASTTKKAFSRQTIVSTTIKADPAIVWTLLTNASDYPRWNSTVISIDGDIVLGEKIRLKSTLDPKRTFKLKIKTVDPERKLTWGDGKGERSYTISQKNSDEIIFTMQERISGLLFPMYVKFIPPFDDSFEAFARDLRQEAEAIQQAQ